MQACAPGGSSALADLPRVVRGLLTHPAARGHPWRQLARFAAWQVRKRVLPRPMTFEVFGGLRLVCHPDSHSASAVWYLGLPDWDTMRLLERVLRPGDGFLDVGANVGVYTLLAASRVGPSGRLVAVEADPGNVLRLRENLALNHLAAEVHPVAAGEAPGEIAFETGADTVSRVGRTEDGAQRVPLARLDDLVADPDRIVAGKMDIEGFELEAMRGARRLLALQRPRLWIVETNGTCARYGTTRARLQAELGEAGYRLYRPSDGGRRLTSIPPGGPFPSDSVAVADPDWVVERIPDLRIEAGAP